MIEPTPEPPTTPVVPAFGLGPELHLRAAAASELSFTLSDPNLPDNPLIWVNPAFERVTGHPAAEVLGRNCRFLQGPGTDPVLVGRIRSAMAARETFADTLLNYRKDGTPFWNQVVISPVLGAEGELTHFVGIQADVTDRVEAQRARDRQLASARDDGARLALLAAVSEGLATHLDHARAVRALADIAVPELASWGVVASVDERGRIGEVHLCAREEVPTSDLALLEELERSWLLRSRRVAAALTAPVTDLIRPERDDLSDLAGLATPAQLEVAERLARGESLVLPLRARSRVIGVLVLIRTDDQPFTEQSIVTAAHVAQRAGLALDNVRLYERERSIALTLQRQMLPDVPHIDGLDIAAGYHPSAQPAEVGGDWFDVLALPGDATGLAVGDVVGHDMQAAAAMGQLRSVLRSYAWSGESAGRVIERLDELVRGLGMAQVATCVYLRLSGDRLEYSRAGHPSPLIRLADGRVQVLDGGLRTPVGVRSLGTDLAQAQTVLPRGATLIAFSDGLVERRDRPLRQGLAALHDAVVALPDGLGATEVRDRLVAELLGPRQEDDVCLLVVRRL